MGGAEVGVLSIFLLLTLKATAQASLAASATCDGAKVSGHVASQTKIRPCFHVFTEASSGLFPSARRIPGAPCGTALLLKLKPSAAVY